MRARIAHRARLEPATSPPRESTRRRDAPFYPSSVSHVSRARRRSRDSASANARPRRRSHEDRAGARLGLPRRVGAQGLVPGRVASRRTNFPRRLRVRFGLASRRARVDEWRDRDPSRLVDRLVSSRLVSRMTTSIDTPDCLPIEIRTGATAVAELTERRARIRRRATARATARARKATTTQQKGARAPCGSLQRRGDAG